MNKQAVLFEDDFFEDEIQRCFFENIKLSGFSYEEVDIGDITFKAGQEESIHRWYRLTPSYSPELVRFFLKEFKLKENDVVFDPFSGRGTTAIECQKKGIECISFEINPLLQAVGEKSLRWSNDYDFSLFNKYITECRGLVKKHHNQTPDEVAASFRTTIPIIHDVYRWWRPSVLRDLIIFRSVLYFESYRNIQDLLWVAINKAALDCANIHRNHPTITFDDDHGREIYVDYEIENNLTAIRNDLIRYCGPRRETSKIICCDSVNIDAGFLGDLQIDAAITSPPYPNRFSYVHQTRPQLHFMELLSDRGAATEIDLKAIGGTWGRATSILQKELIIPDEELKQHLCYYDELSRKSILMCNYATKYFSDMRLHIRGIRPYLKQGFRGAYVVGNSRLSGIEIFTEVILGKIFESEGFSVQKIVSFRKRGGRKRLYETAVVVSR
ncbi:DNA methyltransferase [Methylomagnum ishizawai]|uniref:DNA methyltransferase n=1 Tax=Methylomagnum ishizawai TaxID=1760988 RepID=UPI001C32F471|nr:DNA methyltransferase [Methylomagnum ishizawai]BBL73707.1 modification methylase, putative [Methylomagnum ishizawai]